jgi:hypothetical protein
MSQFAYDPAELFRRVWRTTLDQPGWALLVPDSPVGSIELRRAMWAVLGEFSAQADHAGRPPFVPERLGRFDQQVSTKFHRDGGPAASLLILGYEPSRVRSRFFVADACRAADAVGLGVTTFLAAHNPLFPQGEAALAGVITEVVWPHDHGAVIVVNNSLLPDDAPPGHPLGLLHKGWIEQPDPTATRVINSVGAMPADERGRDALPPEQVERFLSRVELD